MIKPSLPRRRAGIDKYGIRRREWSTLLDQVLAAGDPDPNAFARQMQRWRDTDPKSPWVVRYALALLVESILCEIRGVSGPDAVRMLEARIYPNWARTIIYERSVLRTMLEALLCDEPEKEAILGTATGFISAIVIVGSLNFTRPELERYRRPVGDFCRGLRLPPDEQA